MKNSIFLFALLAIICSCGNQKEQEYFNDHKDQLLILNVSYQANKIKGGISNVFVTVANNYKYAVRNVVVELKYNTRFEGTCHDCMVTIPTINSNQSQTVNADAFDKGITIDSHINSVSCSQIGL